LAIIVNENHYVSIFMKIAYLFRFLYFFWLLIPEKLSHHPRFFIHYKFLRILPKMFSFGISFFPNRKHALSRRGFHWQIPYLLKGLNDYWCQESSHYFNSQRRRLRQFLLWSFLIPTLSKIWSINHLIWFKYVNSNENFSPGLCLSS
jgi:hypothetical protein